MTVGILPVLLHRKRVLLVSGLATACLAFAVSRVLPLEYASKGSLIVENPPTSVAEPANAGVINVLTQVDVLQSRGLSRRVVHDYNLATLPGLVPTLRLPAAVTYALTASREKLVAFIRSLSGSSAHSDLESEHQIVDYVQKHLQATSKENSNVIAIEFEAGTPEVAATVVNAIVKTYLAMVGARHEAWIAQTDNWISQGLTVHKQEVNAAEQRVTEYVQAHDLSAVQGSLTAAIQLSNDQTQLAAARDDLARKQAALDTVSYGGAIAGAQEALDSKAIQTLKEHEVHVTEQINWLSSGDPRRGPLRAELTSIRAQIDRENDLIVASISRAVGIGRVHVEALKMVVQREIAMARDSSVVDATVRQLTADLEAKRQLYVAFLTQAGQMRAVAEQAPTAHILFQGVPPVRPLHKFGVLSLLLGFIGGVSAATGIIVLRTMMNTKINSTAEMALATGLSVFGSLPDVKQLRGTNVLTAPPNASLVTETFRAMWLVMRSQQNEGTTIVVTSSEVEEGKTTIAVALAHRFADDGYRVLLIDADLRCPRLSTAFNAYSTASLETVLAGDVSLEQAIQRVKAGFDCLPTNGRAKNPVDILASDRFKRLLTQSRKIYDFVILDSPPVLHVADPVVLATLCQHVIFIVQSGRLRNDMVGEATRRFAEEDRAKMVALLTRVPRSRLDGRDYYSGYIGEAKP